MNKQTLELQDGRKLSYCVRGNPEGKTVLLLHGSPGHAVYWYRLPGVSEALETFRFVSVDRRGYGESDYLKGTTYLNYVDDIRQLLDHLRTERAVVLAASGGGPFALACAYRMAARVEQVVLASGAGPSRVRQVEEGLSSTSRVVYRVARRLPWLMKLNMRFLARWQNRDPLGYLDKMSYKLAEADKAVLQQTDAQEILKDVYTNSTANSWRGYAQDVVLQANHWGFDPGDIRTKVAIIQANDDTSVPPAVGEYFAQVIPDSTLHIFSNAGHLWHLVNMKEVLSTIDV